MRAEAIKNINRKKAIYVQWIDSLKHFFVGGLEPLSNSIIMLLLIEFYHTTTTEKTIISIAMRLGFVIGIPYIFYASSKKWYVHKQFLSVYLITGFFLFLFILFPAKWILVFTGIAIGFALDGLHTLQTQIYNLYPKSTRGRRSVISIISFLLGGILITLLFGELPSYFNHSFDIYRILIMICGLFFILASFISTRYPRIRFSRQSKISWQTIQKILKEDNVFRKMCIAWFIMGISNLWLLHYRVNLLAEEQFGFNYSPKMVLIIVVLIPEVMRIVMMPLFAYLFDRINFVLLRIILNILFMAYFVFFFLGGNYYNHILGSVFYGLAMSGGGIAWKLWVNKISSYENTSAYMLIHSGLTGIRMVLGPLFGLYALNYMGPAICGIISITLTAISTILIGIIFYHSKHKFEC